MKRTTAIILSLLCLSLTACSDKNIQIEETTTSEVTESETTTILTETTTAPTETTIVSTTRQIPVTTFDETDEILVKGQEFAEAYAEMYWDYFQGAARFYDLNEPYFNYDDKSEGNYFEYDGIPFYKLLITDYTYDKLIDYIKSFYSDELFEEFKENSLIDVLFIGKDNCIYVNGNESVLMYHLRNEHAHIIGYTENDDGSVTYDCFAKTTEEDDDDLYFSFTLNTAGKLCGDYDIFLSKELGLFSDKYYNDTPMALWGDSET